MAKTKVSRPQLLLQYLDALDSVPEVSLGLEQVEADESHEPESCRFGPVTRGITSA